MGKDIYVFIEQCDDIIQKVGLELIGGATKLANELGQKVVAVLLGCGIKAKSTILLLYGADEVIYVDEPVLKHYLTEPYSKVITQIIKDFEPQIFLFGETSIGCDLAPRVAGIVYTGMTADCLSLTINSETELLSMTKPALEENMIETIVSEKNRLLVIIVREGGMQALDIDSTRNGVMRVVNVELKPEDTSAEISERVKEKNEKVDVIEENLIVSCDSGIAI